MRDALYPLTSPLLRYSVAVGATTVCTLIRFSLDRWLGDAAPLTLYPLAVMFSAVCGGLGPGLLATVLAMW